MAEFKGIDEFHDGLAVSDYRNMIPLGTTCVDRVGDRLVFGRLNDSGFATRGTFVDSHHNIYVAYGPSLYRYEYDEASDSIVGEASVMTMYVDGENVPFKFMNDTHRVTFCESSLKPSEVFCCDGQFIYAWATYDGLNRPQYFKFSVNVICPPNITREESSDNGITVNWTDSTNQPDFNSILYGKDKSTAAAAALWRQFKAVYTDTVDWFDNRLVATQLSKNTVWLTRTDPMYYWRDVNSDVAYLEPGDASTGGYELWANWYSSSANSDRLLDIAAYGGQLYLFNAHTVEIWGRTGNEDNPIQSSTSQVLHVGGKLPTIIEGVLFFLGIDSMNDNFIGAFSPQFSRVSNKEIERRLGKVVSLQKLSQYGDTYLFVRRDDGDGYVFGSQRWWRWETPVGATYKILTSVIRDYAIAEDSSIVRFDETSRRSGGAPIPRSIREGFTQLGKRGIIRKVELVADTGRCSDDDDDNRCVYCAVSTNRGLSFSQRRYRTFGEMGKNDKTVEWRNMGSGNSLLVEIGTSAPNKLQIYDMVVNVT